MGSDWIPSKIAIEVLKVRGEQNPEDRLRRALKEAELNARAGAVRAYHLFTQVVSNPGPPSTNDTFDLEHSSALYLWENVKTLPDGRHHHYIGCHLDTVVRKGSRIRIFRETKSLGEANFNHELAPTMWEWASVDFFEGTAVSDNLDGLIRIRATQIEFRRAEVERLSARRILSSQPKKVGRPKKDCDWEKAERLAKQLIYTNPEITQAKVIDQVISHLAQDRDDEPSVSTVKRRMKQFFKDHLGGKVVK